MRPEVSTNLAAWSPVTNGAGGPLSITTPHGSFQWLEVTAPAAGDQKLVLPAASGNDPAGTLDISCLA